MTVGSLFSGFGGMDLGLSWAGFETIWFCENDGYARSVLRTHWPDKPIIDDVRNVTAGTVQRPDVIAGGFPCQDVSQIGEGAGIDYDLSTGDGTRSGLWWEMWRIVCELRPRYVLIENVPNLANGGLGAVLGGLADIGYDAEWTIVSAAAVGAPHLRERLFVVAYPSGEGLEGHNGDVAGISEQGRYTSQQGRPASALRLLPSWFGGGAPEPPWVSERGAVEVERDVFGVAHGVPNRVQRIIGLGNAVVPQVAELVGRAIKQHRQ